ncbi:MAG: SIR2 family NAD-dependent protein deacylase [Gemmatimonadales bacterium]
MVVEALRRAQRVAVLTGAGISAESGIPTFRDALTGLWADHSPQELATPEGFRRNPDLVWSWYRSRRLGVADARPNPGHYALAALERSVPHFTLVTQNVDGLHGRAGSRDPVELHGNIARVKCFDCARIATAFDDTDRVPTCSACGGQLRPDVVWFGEMLPADALRRAQQAAESADLFLSVGTSNLVEPAASLPWLAADAGAVVVVVNTTLAGQRTGSGIHHLIGPAGTVLPDLVRRAWPDARLEIPA